MKYQYLIILLAFQSNLIFSSSTKTIIPALKKNQKLFYESSEKYLKSFFHKRTQNCCQHVEARPTYIIKPANYMGKSPYSDSSYLVIRGKGASFEIPKEKIFLQKNPEESLFKVGEIVYKKKRGKRK